jgi:hypothetical protein
LHAERSKTTPLIVCGAANKGAAQSAHGVPPPPDAFPTEQSSHAVSVTSARSMAGFARS